MSWFLLNRNLTPLEPYDWKLSRTVLRGERGSNAPDLPGKKEDELKQLKADLAALDRRILLSLKSVDAQEKSTDGVIEVVPSQPVTPDGQDNAPAAGISVTGSPSPGSVPTQDTPPAEPYAHRMPDFLADRQRTPPKLSEMPKAFSIKKALGGKLVIGGIPKPGNKDNPGSDQSEKEKPKPKLKL